VTAAPTVAASRPRESAAAWVSADAVAVGVLFLLSGVVAVLTWGTWGDIGSDTGYDVVAGARLASGDLPYSDFVYYYGPLAPALLGLAALFGGSGLGPALVVGMLTAGAIVAATYGLTRLMTGPLGAFLAAAITAGVALEPTNFSFVLPHSSSATLALLCALGFLLALARGQWVLAGVAAGLVTLTRPEFAFAVAAGFVVWVLVRSRARALTRSELKRLIAPALAIPLVVYGVLAAFVGPHQLVFENLYPVDELRQGGDAILGAYAPFTTSSFADIGLKLVAYAAGTALLLGLAGGVARAGRLWQGVFAAAVVIAAVAAAIASPEALRSGLYLVYEWIPAGAAAAFAVLAVRAWRDRERSPVAHLELATLAVLVVLAAKTYAAFMFHAAPHEQLAVYAAPFAAIFLVRVHVRGRGRTLAAGALWLAFVAAAGFGLTLKDARAESAAVTGPNGTVHATRSEAATYNAVLDWITAGTRPGDPVFIAPQLTLLYTLSGRENPLNRISLLPGALATPADERAAIAQLERSGVRLAVIDKRPFSEYGGHTSFGESFDQLVSKWLHQHFVLARTYRSGDPTPRPVEIWVRRSS
jgi:hypothetical protein